MWRVDIKSNYFGVILLSLLLFFIIYTLYSRNCVGSLSLLDLPGESPILINDLTFDMRTSCMFTLLKQAISGKCKDYFGFFFEQHNINLLMDEEE